MRLLPALTLPLALLLVVGCGPKKDRPDNAAWETRKGHKSLGTDDVGEVETGSKTLWTGQEWVGVRHDLALNPRKKPDSSCNCLAVSVGSPNDDAFVWRGPRPDVNSSQIALAITALVPDCPGGPAEPGDRRASISAIDRKGKDVFVEIEDLPSDRPIASGAIIHPLEPGGHVYVRPRNKKVPYGRVTGRELCRVK